VNTLMTNELEKFLLESNASSDLGKFQRMTGHARWCESQLTAEREKVKQLRDVVSKCRAEFIAMKHMGDKETEMAIADTTRVLDATK